MPAEARAKVLLARTRRRPLRCLPSCPVDVDILGEASVLTIRRVVNQTAAKEISISTRYSLQHKIEEGDKVGHAPYRYRHAHGELVVSVNGAFIRRARSAQLQ